MSHSKMLTSRRKKQRGRKQLARIAKQAKKLRNINAKAGGAGAAKEGRDQQAEGLNTRNR